MDTTALTDPREYFADRRRYSLTIPLVAIGIVFVLGVAGPLLEWLFVPALEGEMAMPEGETEVSEEDLETFAEIAGLLAVVFALVWKAFVVFWYVGWFHLLTELFDGDGPVRATVAVVGWGFVPKVIHEFVRFLESAWMVVQVEVLNVAAEDAGVGIVGNLLVVLVAVLMLAWSAYIWYGGLRSARDVDTTGAGVSVALPLLGAVLVLLIASFGRLA